MSTVQHQSQHNSVTALILAGGRSSRMGQPKPWLKDKQGVTFVERIVNAISSSEIEYTAVVLNVDFIQAKWQTNFSTIQNKALVIPNLSPDEGRLYSIFLGLQNVCTAYSMIFNVDNPYVQPEIIKQIIAQAEKGDVIVPRHNGQGGHPILFNHVVKKELLTNYSSYTSLKDVFDNFKRFYVDVDDKSILININTPEDIETLKHELV